MKKVVLECTGEVLEQWLAWRAELLRCEAEWQAYALSIGATKRWGFPFMGPSAFSFKGTPPEGWTQDKGRGSRPKRANKPDSAALKALPDPEQPYVVAARTGLPTGYSYRKPDTSRGSTTWGDTFSIWSPHWCGDRFFLQAGDSREVVAECEAEGYIVTLNPEGAQLWPEGYVEITEAQRDLVFAQAAVAAESS